MVKTLLVFFILIKLSFSQENNVSFYLSNDKNNVIEGEFLGTYMGYVHVLTGEKINYFSCKEINEIILKNSKKRFSYDCNKNTISPEILFPPKLDPMTGEWMQKIPKAFEPNFISTKEKVTDEHLSEDLVSWELENESVYNYNKKDQEDQIQVPDVNLKPLELVKVRELNENIFLTRKEIILLIQEELEREELKIKKEGATDLGSFMKYIFDKGLIGTLNSRPHYILVPCAGYIFLILLFNA